MIGRSACLAFVRRLCEGRVDARRLPGVPGPGEGGGEAVGGERGARGRLVWRVGEGEWAKGKEERLAHTWLHPESRCREREPFPSASSASNPPARQVGGVGRVPRKYEVSPPCPSPMHSLTRGLQVDKGRSLYDNRSRMVVATCLVAASPVLDCAPVQLYVVPVVEGDSWRCASLSATLRIPLRAQE